MPAYISGPPSASASVTAPESATSSAVARGPDSFLRASQQRRGQPQAAEQQQRRARSGVEHQRRVPLTSNSGNSSRSSRASAATATTNAATSATTQPVPAPGARRRHSQAARASGSIGRATAAGSWRVFPRRDELDPVERRARHRGEQPPGQRRERGRQRRQAAAPRLVSLRPKLRSCGHSSGGGSNQAVRRIGRKVGGVEQAAAGQHQHHPALPDLQRRRGPGTTC
jgi:hypothetical protein